MSYVKLIEKLFILASRRERASYSRLGREIYLVEKGNGKTTLFHYDTKTVEVENGEICHLYGIGRSDVDSINTLLSNLGINSVRVGFKPVNGGFYAWIPSLRKELFLNDYDCPVDFAKGIQSHLAQDNALSRMEINNYSNPMPVL